MAIFIVKYELYRSKYANYSTITIDIIDIRYPKSILVDTRYYRPLFAPNLPTTRYLYRF